MLEKRLPVLLFSISLTLSMNAMVVNEGQGEKERPKAVEQEMPATEVQEDHAGSWPVKTLTLLLNLTREEQLFT